MKNYVAATALATGWSPGVVQENTYDMLDRVATASRDRASRQSGTPTSRGLEEWEAADLEDDRKWLKSIGLVK